MSIKYLLTIPDYILFQILQSLSFDMQILKDGMQHVGKLVCSNLGARMDSEPKCWRILGLHLYSGAHFYTLCLVFSTVAYLVLQVND